MDIQGCLKSLFITLGPGSTQPAFHAASVQGVVALYTNATAPDVSYVYLESQLSRQICIACPIPRPFRFAEETVDIAGLVQ